MDNVSFRDEPNVTVKLLVKLSFFKPAAVCGINLLLAGCVSSGGVPEPMNYPTTYKKESQHFADNQNENFQQYLARLKKFQALFSDFKQPELANLVSEAYAENLYFNDTIKSFTNREELSEYLVETGERVEYTRVQFDDIVESGDNFYIRWTMEVGFKVMGKMIQTESIGMSQIRLNNNDKVVFHQDFWDSSEGFYRHLPVIGFFINKTQNRL